MCRGEELQTFDVAVGILDRDRKFVDRIVGTHTRIERDTPNAVTHHRIGRVYLAAVEEGRTQIILPLEILLAAIPIFYVIAAVLAV